MKRTTEETVAMMKELQGKLMSDLKKTMEKETESHCSKIKLALSEMKHCTQIVALRNDNDAQNCPQHGNQIWSDLRPQQLQASMDNDKVEKENEQPPCSSSDQHTSEGNQYDWMKFSSSFLRKRSQFMSAPETTKTPPCMKGSPQTPAPQYSTDFGALVKEIERSLTSMESSILKKISLQMEKDALHQRKVLEDIIEEKVTQVIAGANLELQLGMQEVRNEISRASKISSHRRVPSNGSMQNNGFISPIRYSTPNRCPTVITKSNNICRSPQMIRMPEEPNNKSLEDSFAETMSMIDDFVIDCDVIVNDFDKIASRMQDSHPDIDST